MCWAEQSLQHVGIHYSAERELQGCFEGIERHWTVALHEPNCRYAIEITLNL